MARAYYNEIDPYAAQWLRNLIAAGHIPDGDVDVRSIAEVQPGDLAGYTQCHFFAGIAGWAYAARLAGWPDDRPLWTGSCPCQPFSVAGKGKGAADERHLWPEFFRLIAACRPPVVMGEQVAAAVGKSWLDGVCADLEGIGYACGAAVVPACAVDAPHRRDRLWFVADADNERWDGRTGRVRGSDGRDEPPHCGPSAMAYTYGAGLEGRSVGGNGPRQGSTWSDGVAVPGYDGKIRRAKSGLHLLVDGVPTRVGRLRAYGNAIVPAVAAEVIGAYLDAAQS